MRPIRTLALLALAAVPVGCVRDTAPEDLAAVEEGARAAIEAYVDAASALDLDSAGSFYSDSDDFQWLEQGVVRYGSAQAARESFAGLAAMASSARLTLSDLTVTALGPVAAVATCHFVQEIGIDGGAGFSFSGAMTIVLRNEDGRWVFVSGHSSSAETGQGAAAAPATQGRT